MGTEFHSLRRHLTELQRAMLAHSLLERFKEEAEERQQATLKQNQDHGGARATTGPGKARDQVAAVVGVGGKTSTACVESPAPPREIAD